MRLQRFETVHDPVQFSRFNINHQTMHGNFRADERAAARVIARLDHILPFAAERAEKFRQVFRQPAAVHAERLQFIQQR